MQIIEVSPDRVNIGDIGFSQENNDAQLHIELPEKLLGFNSYDVEFELEKGDKSVLKNVEVRDNIIIVPLYQNVLEFGKLYFQIVAYNFDVDQKSKSNLYFGHVQRSINATETIEIVPEVVDQIYKEILTLKKEISSIDGMNEEEVYNLIKKYLKENPIEGILSKEEKQDFIENTKARHTHSNKDVLDEITQEMLDKIGTGSIPTVYELPTDAKDGDMCLYAPQNTLTLEDSGKRIYFDWEEFAKLVDEMAYAGVACWFDNGYQSVEIFCSRNFDRNELGVILYSKDGSEMITYSFAFENGELHSDSNYTCDDENGQTTTYYTIVDELPLYLDLPKFSQVEVNNIDNPDNVFMFCTEYRLMKYQGGEWVELTDDINNAIESLKSQITSIPKFSISVVDTLPTEDISETTVYLVKDNETEGNLYTEYVYINNVWEKLGTQTLDLEGYAKTEDVYTKQEIDDKEFITESDLPNNGVYVGSGEMPDNCNLQIDPNGDAIVIPTKTSELENDSGFITNNKIELTTETATLQPNIYYSFGETIVLTLEFAEGDPTKLNGYMFGFISGATPTVLALPSNIKWGNDNEIVIESGKQYEVCIVNNIALWTAAAVEAVS